MTNQDIRWIQRFNNFCKAIIQLTRFMQKQELNELEEQGLIQSFEYTHELAWNTLKDFIESKGNKTIYGSKDATREAFKLDLITAGDIWMDMIRHRNLTSHTYNEELATEIVKNIRQHYYREFIKLEEILAKLKIEEANE